MIMLTHRQFSPPPPPIMRGLAMSRARERIAAGSSESQIARGDRISEAQVLNFSSAHFQAGRLMLPSLGLTTASEPSLRKDHLTQLL
ncbi:hypothetical protein OH76DRAFT_1405857 [Lentinus brumalis]|uniref:Uncharacterized protein n=1 Tax=Lentinus brumalis TaxID=2498619 RepID=A0A371D4U4_9APHY|nr:hypothetical protein OH76DRAFT_1405857 [Polyporus brumalis]